MKLYWNTVSNTLRQCLDILMGSDEFKDFRLVGGAALSLQLGHRISVDIDLFTDNEYGSIDFSVLEKFLKANFNYVDTGFGGNVGMGKAYLIGTSKNDSVKLDVYYSNDSFIQDGW